MIIPNFAPKPGADLRKDYTLKSVLGEGAFGQVKVGIRKGHNNKERAVKIVKKSALGPKQLLKLKEEVRIQ